MEADQKSRRRAWIQMLQGLPGRGLPWRRCRRKSESQKWQWMKKKKKKKKKRRRRRRRKEEDEDKLTVCFVDLFGLLLKTPMDKLTVCFACGPVGGRSSQFVYRLVS